MNFIKKNILITTLLLLSACASVPHIEDDIKQIRLPEKWQTQAVIAPKTAVKTAWYQQLDDALLRQYIETAQAHNADIEIATYHLQQHLLQSDLALVNRLPKLSANLGVSGSRPLKGGESSRRFSLSSGISWQLDLLGSLAKTHDVKKWLAHASQDDLLHIKNTIINQTADTYWQLAALNQQISLAKQDIQSGKQFLKMMQTRYQVGDVAQMDVLQSEQDLRQKESIYNNLQHRRNQTRHALSLLLGDFPNHTLKEPLRLPETQLPQLPLIAPVAILDSRADVRAARWRLMADMGNVDIAVRHFFPQFNLNLSASAANQQLAQIVQNPIGSLGLDILLPFLNWSENQLNLKSSKLQYQANLTAFKKTLYSALNEVENALSQQKLLQKEKDNLQKNWLTAKKLSEIHQLRYQYGSDSLHDFLQIDNQRRQAENALIQNRLARYQNFLALRLALGEIDGNPSN